MDAGFLLDIPPYSLKKEEKEGLLSSYLFQLSVHHYQQCEPYRKMMDSVRFNPLLPCAYPELPFLPVRLFKQFELRSVPPEEVVKTMTSSGTTGQAVSRIFLDRTTSSNQTKALTKIVSSFLGTQRLPMIIIDSEEVIRDRRLFSARGAGILGFSIFGSKRFFALDERMELKLDALRNFIDQFPNERILLFGFTFMIYQHFYKELVKAGQTIQLSNGILIHGGGWKKLTSEAITPSQFKERLKTTCHISEVHDYYGMVEQTGSIYMECEHGHLHTPVISDVLIRRPFDFSLAEKGEKGIIQVVSALPQSYPGHSLLTEDEGVLLGEDDCPCGRMGKYFHIVGRLKNAEIRGCSDTYATKF